LPFHQDSIVAFALYQPNQNAQKIGPELRNAVGRTPEICMGNRWIHKACVLCKILG